MKKILTFLSFILLLTFLVGCDAWFSPLFSTTEKTTISYTKINGTITFEDSDYQNLPFYYSDTYNLNDIDQYNQILLDTKDHIRKSNILVNTVYYSLRFPWASSNNRNVLSIGSGFIFLEDEEFYYALTNYHVIDSNQTDAVVEIKTFSDTEFVLAEVVVYDSDLDLAVLKFAKDSREEVVILDIYERLYYRFTPGELVLAVGNPGSLTNNVTFGEFKSRENLNDVSFRVIYHDANIAKGSSGGALVDVDGNLIGINTWGLEDSDEHSFAIPNYIIYMFLINNGILD